MGSVMRISDLALKSLLRLLFGNFQNLFGCLHARSQILPRVICTSVQMRETTTTDENKKAGCGGGERRVGVVLVMLFNRNQTSDKHGFLSMGKALRER